MFMELLRKIEDRGYPTEYLLSRVRGRRMRYRDSIARESPEGVWRCLLKEYQWVYLQMNRQLQDIFGSFFFYAELRTIVLCLRYRIRGKEIVEELLSFSLLSDGLKDILKRGSSILTTIEDIGEALLPLSFELRGLKEIFIKDGLRGAEQVLTNTYLEHTARSIPHPTIRDFFAYLIDSRNIIALYKHLRWGIPDYPIFIHGGSIKEGRLRRIAGKQDTSGLLSLIHKLTGIMNENLDVTNIENSLLKGLTSFLRRFIRDPLCAGVILDYLWRCYIETMNQSIILYGNYMDKEMLLGELIQ